MKLTTIQNITSDQWKAQADRFSSITDKTNNHNYPKTGATNLQAIIEMEVVQPLREGFKGRVKYIQQFEKLIDVPDPNNEGQTIEKSTTVRHLVVDYYELIDKEGCNALFAQLLPLVPTDITGYLEKQDWCIQQAFINQVVAKQTFGGLGADDYVLTV